MDDPYTWFESQAYKSQGKVIREEEKFLIQCNNCSKKYTMFANGSKGIYKKLECLIIFDILFIY